MVEHCMLYQLDMREIQMSLSLFCHLKAEGYCQPDYPRLQGMMAVPFDNTPLRKEEEEMIKVHVSNMKHMSKAELKRD